MKRKKKLGRGQFLGFQTTEADGALIETLRPNYAEILKLAGLSYDDMAEVLGVEVGTVRSRLNRARAALVAARTARHLLHGRSP